MKKIAIIALVALFIPQIALGWGQLGHRTIAEIAERNLTPKAKANIEKYTGGTPLWKYSLFVDEYRNHPDYKEALDGLHASIAALVGMYGALAQLDGILGDKKPDLRIKTPFVSKALQSDDEVIANFLTKILD